MFSVEFKESFLREYTPEEIKSIRQDLRVVTEMSFYEVLPHDSTSSTPLQYIATAGAPGSGKSTTLEAFLREHDLMNRAVYADPDTCSLPNMIYTYRKAITPFNFAASSSNHAALKAAYDKWRGASNYITHEILSHAFGGESGEERKYWVAQGLPQPARILKRFMRK